MGLCSVICFIFCLKGIFGVKTTVCDSFTTLSFQKGTDNVFTCNALTVEANKCVELQILLFSHGVYYYIH